MNGKRGRGKPRTKEQTCCQLNIHDDGSELKIETNREISGAGRTFLLGGGGAKSNQFSLNRCLTESRLEKTTQIGRDH